MRKIILTLLALVAATTATLAVTSNANAASYNSTPRCMTKAEWNRILSDDDNGMGGMSRDQVAAIVGYAARSPTGPTYSDGTADIDVDYRQCLRNGRRSPDAWDYVWHQRMTTTTTTRTSESTGATCSPPSRSPTRAPGPPPDLTAPRGLSAREPAPPHRRGRAFVVRRLSGSSECIP